jgi:predicted dehydrogenase
MTGLRSRNAGRRIALVGVGKQGRKLAEALAALGYEIVAGCDLDAASRQKFSGKHPDAIVTQKISELARVSPELVVVGTLAGGHLPVIRELDAIDVKKIFCEKPVVGSIVDLRDLRDLVAKRGLEVAVNHANLWNPEFQTVKERVQSEPLGKLRRAAAHFKPAGFGNMGSHNLAAALQFLETRITSVRSATFSKDGTKKRAARHQDRNGRATFLLENGIELELDNLLTVVPRTWRIVFEFDRGRIELLQEASCYVVWNGATGRISEIPFQLRGYGLKKSPETAYTLLDRAVSSLLNGEPQESFDLACQAVEGIIAAHHCFVNATPVSLPLERETETLFGFS